MFLVGQIKAVPGIHLVVLQDADINRCRIFVKDAFYFNRHRWVAALWLKHDADLFGRDRFDHNGNDEVYIIVQPANGFKANFPGFSYRNWLYRRFRKGLRG
jgi:hypothetical protein